jgi:hypothetical protein
MSLGANGMPDNLIEEGLKQPDHIKIFGHVTPDQAQFGPKYFLMFTLPNFKSKILLSF